MEIERIDGYTDPRFSPEVLRQHGAFLADGQPWSFRIVSDREAVVRMTEAAGVTRLVDYIISGQDCTAHKPSPEIYLRALEALGLTSDTAVAVEDSAAGIAAAKGAGLRVYALRPRHGEAIDQSAADAVLDSLADVWKFL